jgi:hypothetical protein
MRCDAFNLTSSSVAVVVLVVLALLLVGSWAQTTETNASMSISNTNSNATTSTTITNSNAATSTTITNSRNASDTPEPGSDNLSIFIAAGAVGGLLLLALVGCAITTIVCGRRDRKKDLLAAAGHRSGRLQQPPTASSHVHLAPVSHRQSHSHSTQPQPHSQRQSATQTPVSQRTEFSAQVYADVSIGSPPAGADYQHIAVGGVSVGYVNPLNMPADADAYDMVPDQSMVDDGYASPQQLLGRSDKKAGYTELKPTALALQIEADRAQSQRNAIQNDPNYAILNSTPNDSNASLPTLHL